MCERAKTDKWNLKMFDGYCVGHKFSIFKSQLRNLTLLTLISDHLSHHPILIIRNLSIFETKLKIVYFLSF